MHYPFFYFVHGNQCIFFIRISAFIDAKNFNWNIYLDPPFNEKLSTKSCFESYWNLSMRLISCCEVILGVDFLCFRTPKFIPFIFSNRTSDPIDKAVKKVMPQIGTHTTRAYSIFQIKICQTGLCSSTKKELLLHILIKSGQRLKKLKLNPFFWNRCNEGWKMLEIRSPCFL